MVVFSAIGLFSCGQNETPVDKYVKLLDEATEKTERIHNLDELMQARDIISVQEIMEIARESKDYCLKDSDREKIKKSYDLLLRTTYKKTIEYGNFTEEMNRRMESQVENFIEEANKRIDKIQTFGELGALQ